MKHIFIIKKHILKILFSVNLIALSAVLMTACSSNNSHQGNVENGKGINDYTSTEKNTTDSITNINSTEESTINSIIDNTGSEKSTINNDTDSSTQYNKEVQAGILAEYCRSIYAGVVSGTINNEDSNVTWAAEKDSLAADKNAAANAITIQQVLSYSEGLEDMEAEIVNGNYYYCADKSPHSDSYVSVGDIKFSDTGVAPMGSDFYVTFNKLSLNTTLGELYGR